MSLFAKNKDIAVQSFLLKLVNNNSPQLKSMIDGPRLDARVNLTVVAWIVPVENGRPLAGKAFTTVTKEFSCNGTAIVLDQPMGLDELIIGFHFEREMRFFHAIAKHLNPMGGGFYQLGVRMTDVAHPGDYPELESLHL